MQKIEHKTLKERVNVLISGLSQDRISVASLLELIGQEGMLVFCIFLTLPFMVPVSIPGVSTVFGALIVLLGFGLLFNRTIWAPKRLKAKTISAQALKVALQKGLIWVERIEKISRPRFASLTRGYFAHCLNSLSLIFGAMLLIAPFGFIPFSNTLPGLAILLLAVGILQKDGICVLLGYLMNIATVVYFAFLLAGGAVALQKVLGFFKGCA
jgi:hypothetical protein